MLKYRKFKHNQPLFFTYEIIIPFYRRENTLLKEPEILSTRIKRVNITHFIFLSKKRILNIKSQ